MTTASMIGRTVSLKGSTSRMVVTGEKDHSLTCVSNGTLGSFSEHTFPRAALKVLATPSVWCSVTDVIEIDAALSKALGFLVGKTVRLKHSPLKHFTVEGVLEAENRRTLSSDYALAARCVATREMLWETKTSIHDLSLNVLEYLERHEKWGDVDEDFEARALPELLSQEFLENPVMAVMEVVEKASRVSPEIKENYRLCLISLGHSAGDISELSPRERFAANEAKERQKALREEKAKAGE